MPNNFRASRLRNACAKAGTRFEPGKSHRSINRSKPIAASAGTNRNSPPNLVRNARGSRPQNTNVRGLGDRGLCLGGAFIASRRRGNLLVASPLLRSTWDTATADRGQPSFFRALLMS